MHIYLIIDDITDLFGTGAEIFNYMDDIFAAFVSPILNDQNVIPQEKPFQYFFPKKKLCLCRCYSGRWSKIIVDVYRLRKLSAPYSDVFENRVTHGQGTPG